MRPHSTLDAVPVRIAGWTASDHVPAEVLPVDRHVGDHLFRTYTNGGRTVWVSVGYYPAQGEGSRPTAQQLLYPGSGWVDLSADTVRIPLDGGASLSANLLFMRTEGQQLGILYWYQAWGRSIASDHWYRALLLYQRLVHRRADGAFVRIAAPVSGGDPAATIATLGAFSRVFYPEMLRSLPQ